MPSMSSTSEQWLAWLREDSGLARTSRRKPPAARLLEVASALGLDVPASELELASRVRAMKLERTVLDSGVGDFDSPASDLEDVVVHPLRELGDPEREPDDDEEPFGELEGDWVLEAGKASLAGLGISADGLLPVILGTADVPGGWGWLLLEDRGEDEPEAWLLPLGLTIHDVVLVHACGLMTAITRSEDSLQRAQNVLRSSSLSPTHRDFVAHCLARLRIAAERWSSCKGVRVRSGRSLAEGATLVLERLASLEDALAEAHDTPPAELVRASWPDADIEDEDELAEAIVDAYSASEWTSKELRRLLMRGGRYRKPISRKWPRGTPKLLRTFLTECGTRGSGMELSDAVATVDDGQGPLFSVFEVGNGDRWLCTAEGQAHFHDHEDFFDRSSPIALGSLLAAWLFYDEVSARELTEHPDLEAHAIELCPIVPGSVFERMDV